uniref:C2 domain-containing protein n=1 Tax=Wuchereria bancrofti TaxID=6293 RepID=A0A1I8EH40_WUCBA
MYQPRGTDYVLCSIGIISLKRLISINESYSGVLHMKSLHDGCLFATIEYDISINSKMINALILQKKKLTTVSMGALTDTDELINQSMYNVLIVNIQRCANLDKLINDNYAPTTLISYELYDYDAWRTQSVINDINPEYNSIKTWLLPTGNDLYNVLRSSHLTIVVLEKQTHSNEERQIGYVNIALYPLVHNNEISGTFPLHSMITDIPTEASIDISISWKFPYHPPEPELELTSTMENVKQSTKTNSIMKEGKLINGWSNLRNSSNEKEIDGKTYELDDLSRKCHNNESQKVPPNLMENTKQSSMINDEFIATNAYFEGENFNFHIDSMNDIKKAMPKAIDIVNDNDDKLDNTQNQLTNMEEMNEQHKSSILSGKRRKILHAVGFADPIQEIFSPSTSSMDETINSWTGDDGQIIEDDISIISCKYSQLNEKLPDLPSSNNYIIELIVGSLHINEQSKLIDPLYDDQSIYIEWKLLDFPSEECETTGELLPLPPYTLSDKQYYLLRQWIEHGNRLEINLVSNGNNLKSSEDLGVAYAELDAQYNAEKRLIQFTDINGIEVASIDINFDSYEDIKECGNKKWKEEKIHTVKKLYIEIPSIVDINEKLNIH